MRRSEVLPAAPFDIAALGELISEPTRVAMLLSLFDGRARPASELAAIGGVTPSTASTHLARLLAGNLVTAERRGRHRYFQLASEEVAAALEALALVHRPRRPPREETDP